MSQIPNNALGMISSPNYNLNQILQATQPPKTAGQVPADPGCGRWERGQHVCSGNRRNDGSAISGGIGGIGGIGSGGLMGDTAGYLQLQQQMMPRQKLFKRLAVMKAATTPRWQPSATSVSWDSLVRIDTQPEKTGAENGSEMDRRPLHEELAFLVEAESSIVTAKNFQGARDVFTGVKELFPQYEFPEVFLGTVEFQQGHFEAAEATTQKLWR